MICTSQAIVLNKKKFSDSSLICTIYAQEYGKLSIIAKGARSIKNPSGAILEPLNHIDLVYYYKPKRNIQLFKEGSIITKHYSISDNYKKSLYSLIILDVINYTSYVESPCNIIFRLIKSSLHYIDQSSEDKIIYYYLFFKLQLLIYLGYEPILNFCSLCDQKIESGVFSQTTGQIVCNKCSSNKKIINNESLLMIKKISKTHIKDLSNINKMNKKVLLDIQKYLFKFILYHIPELKKSKAFIALNT